MSRIPGGLMVVPLMPGALMSTIDQAHLPFLEKVLKSPGTAPTKSGNYEFLRVGGALCARDV